MDANEYVLHDFVATRLREATVDAARRASLERLSDERRAAERRTGLAMCARALTTAASGLATVATGFAIAARIVENAGSKLMNARRRAASEG